MNVKLFFNSLHICYKTTVGVATILGNFNSLKLFQSHLKIKRLYSRNILPSSP